MIKILTGRQTDPLQEKILEEAVENYKNNPEYETFIIVPNHIKFTTEIKAINKLAKSKGQSETSVKNLQVLSFSRLAWYFLKEKEQGLPTRLDDAASAMLLGKIIKEKQSELSLFKNVTVNTGLVKQLYDTILQIHEGNIDLDSFSTNELNDETSQKLHDIKVIYESFINEIEGKFSTKNEVQLELNKVLAKRKDLKNLSFYFTDFSHFSLQELLTIQILAKKAKNVTLAFKTKIGEINLNSKEGDYDFVIQQTIQKLVSFFNSHNLKYETNTFPLNIKQDSRELLNSIWTEAIPNPDELKQVQLVKADSRYAEAYFVARTIFQQVALSNYRYKDFLVIAPNLHEYETYLIPILRKNGIPFFNDLQQEMKYHPLVVLIENLANLLENNLSTSNIIAILKTCLLIPDWYKDETSYLHNVDQLENFVLAHGINHQAWKKDFSEYLKAEVIRLDKDPEQVNKINRLREFIVKRITTLLTALKNETDTRQALTIFFNFLTKNGVAKRLDIWRNSANEKGDLQQAQQPEQLWNLLMQLLQDYLLINPEEFHLQDFFDLLISGFREATFSQIPSTLDAVNISEMGMVQNSGYKQVFIIGATSGNLPKIEKTPGFLSSENLQQLASNFNENSYLEDHQSLNNLDQNYQLGLALALAQDRVYLSYPILNAANEELKPSIFYEKLKNKHASEFIQHDLPDNLQDILSFITNPDASLGYLSYLNSIEPNEAVDQLIALSKKKLPEKTQQVLTASKFENEPENIGVDLAQKLYGNNLNSSVTQLETYYENSYEYFLNYGLRLRKRFENELDVIQAGNYFHETFDRLVKQLKKDNLDLEKIDQFKLETLLNLVRSEMKKEGKYAQLMNDPFNQYLFKCLDHSTSKVATNWRKNLAKTPLRARYSELSFGKGEKIKGLNFDLPDLEGNHEVYLRGKMDRVDLADFKEKNQILAQVIDYKSSAKNFDLGLFYNGISLQMISYLDVLNKNAGYFAKDNELALLGAFYQTITKQLERLNSSKLVNSSLEIKNNLLDSKPKLMYTGLISNDPDLLLEAEPLLNENSVSSNLYNGVKTKKKGGFSLPSNRNFSNDEIKMLLKYNEYLIKAAANKILSGEIKLNPFKYGKSQNALTYSEYRDIFFFDAMLRENKYHNIESLNKKQLLTKIKEKIGKEDE